MAGALTISTLNNDTGVLATQNGMNGIAKAWVKFTASSATIASSFNVSSITRNSTGYFTVNMTTALPSANYSVTGNVGMSGQAEVILSPFVDSSVNLTTPTTTSFTIITTKANVGFLDGQNTCVAVFSS